MRDPAEKEIACTTEGASGVAQRLRVRVHTFRADLSPELGGFDSAPGPHDYFDAALAACKALTATWYAKQKGIALERVEVRVTRDDEREREGKYALRVELGLFGELTNVDRRRLAAAVANCPVHKLMTTSEVSIETLLLAETETP